MTKMTETDTGRSAPVGVRDRLFRGWVVVIAGFFVMTVLIGIRYSFGIFFKSIEGEFVLSRTVTSAIFAAYMALYPAAALLAGWASDKYRPGITIIIMGVLTALSLILTSRATSPWHLFVTYGLLLSLGTTGVYTVVVSTTSRWFDRNRGLAVGIASSGSGLGILVMAPFATYLISGYGWRDAYLIMGLVAGTAVILLSTQVKKNPAGADGAGGLTPSSTAGGSKGRSQAAELSIGGTLRTQDFWLLWLVWLGWSLCLHLTLTHIVPHATDTGISAPQAAGVLGLIGGSSIVGRMVMGGVSDTMGRRLSAAVCAALQAGTVLWLIWAGGVWTFYLIAILYGFGYGGIDAPIAALVGDIFGMRRIGVILGMLSVAWGLGAMAGPLIGGLIFDVTSSYSLAFLAAALAMLTTVWFIAFIGRAKKPETDKSS